MILFENGFMEFLIINVTIYQLFIQTGSINKKKIENSFKIYQYEKIFCIDKYIYLR